MSVSDFGGRVAACSDVEGSPKYGAILEIITLILPILLSLPCFKSATPEQAQAKIEQMPGLARLRAKSLIRSRAKNKDVARDAGAIADNMLNEMTVSTPVEFASVYSAARAA